MGRPGRGTNCTFDRSAGDDAVKKRERRGKGEGKARERQGKDEYAAVRLRRPGDAGRTGGEVRAICCLGGVT